MGNGKGEGAFGGYDDWLFIFACMHGGGMGCEGMVIHERHVWP